MFELNRGQMDAYRNALEWWNSRKRWRTPEDRTFEISGGPGTGKTFLINCIIDALGIDRSRIAPMAYTGAAAINMRSKGMYNATTIYSTLYNCVEEPVLDENGKVVYDIYYNKPKTRMKFVEKKEIPDIDLFIIDESGAVPQEMRTVIDRKGIPVIAAGDLDQLPPITGKSGYLRNPKKINILTEIMRQNADNAIIRLSHIAKNYGDIRCGWYGNVLVIYEDQLTDDMIAKSQIVICGKNDTRDKMTYRIRKNIIHADMTPDLMNTFPHHGERIVCRKNNWCIESDGISLTNGLLGNVVSFPDASSINMKNKTFTIDFKPDLGNVPFYGLECDLEYFVSNTARRKEIRGGRYSTGEKFEYGYCITTHMAQGSEFNNGIYIEEFLRSDINNKLNYVGLTRFKNFCIYVKKR